MAGNWKMNASKESVNKLVLGILSGMDNVSSKVVICAPFPYLSQVEALISHSQVSLGAQNLNINTSGAFTGEVSADMIKDFGAQHVIVGHSERRSLYGETNTIVAEKVKAALDSDLIPLFCVGETLEQREAGETESVVADQINTVVDLVGIAAFLKIVVAYEPVWAIGTGITADTSQIEEAHQIIRDFIMNKDEKLATEIRILYGGSVKPGNAAELIGIEGVDGFLVGGASLSVDSFMEITQGISDHYDKG